MKKGEKKKAKWEKIRAQKAKEREAEAAKPKEVFKPFKREFMPMQPRVSRHVMTEGMQKTAALPSRTTAPSTKPAQRVQLSPEMAERELAAQQETERKKKRVAPLANKMGYQYIGDAPPEIIETLGRKT